jgi:hypothetical protein
MVFFFSADGYAPFVTPGYSSYDKSIDGLNSIYQTSIWCRTDYSKGDFLSDYGKGVRPAFWVKV